MQIPMNVPKIPMIARMALVLLMALALGACDPDEQPVTPPQTSSDANALLRLSFYHIQDSDGGKGAEGVDVILLFEPNGIADLYTARATEAIAYKGSYSVNDGKISLKFNHPDFKADASFSIDTSQSTVTMPFKAFSGTAGTSTWRRERKPAEHNFQVIFAAATLAENLQTDKAVERVVTYAQALMAIGQAEKRSFAKAAPTWTITGVKKMTEGVRVQYDKGPYVNVQLFSWSPQNGKPLENSPLLGDPRLYLDVASPHDGSADPIEKTALFIAPFDSDRETVSWYDYNYVNRQFTSPPELAQEGLSGIFRIDVMTWLLEQSGYRVKVLKDGEANLPNIIEALTPGKDGRSHSPGFISMITHGSSNGNLLTGTILGTDSTWREGFQDVVADLKAHGYADLLAYGGGTEDNPATICATVLSETMRPGRKGSLVYSLTVTPQFWEWLHTRRADFSRSLVFIAACLTDINPALRESIRSRAYFSFDVPVYSGFAAKALQYFCNTLTRPTFSAEEAYYNLIRVMNTKKMIYTEDMMFNNMIPEIAKQADEAIYFFKGYGYNGKEVVPYLESGWFNTPNTDQGGIWWLLFSGRWGQDAQKGADGMLSCWQSVWKNGSTGGLGDPICHNKTPGRVPTVPEIAYASYLLTGKVVMDSPGIKFVPRWTLNDGR